MKKYLFFAASALAVVSCSNDDYLGNNDGNGQGTNSAILFDGGTSKTTRAEATIGANNTYKTTSLQQNGFWVYGYKKKTGSDDQVVYQNYYLKYIENSGNQSQTNTKGWEYVGVDNSAYADAVTPHLTEAQTIKYWDYSADSYTFFAATAKPQDLKDGKVVIKMKEDTKDQYTVTLKTDADLASLYFADKVGINTKNNTVNREAENEIGGLVKFQFRNALAKVRVAVFETIPGYSVKINKFYYTDNDTEASDEKNFAADVTNTKLGLTAEGVNYQVTFDNDGQAVLQPRESGEGSQKSYITLGSNFKDKTLGEDALQATYDYADKDYTWFIAQPKNDSDLKLKVDYTLTSDDNSGEQIKVTGATAVIPADLLKWKNNYAYTYIFKITDQTNGGTGGDDDPKGLYPITFDAAVIETGDGIQETITTVSDPSITTYGKGAVDNEYKANTNIYVSVAKYAVGSAIDLNQTNTKLYVVTKETNMEVTEANVANCLKNGKKSKTNTKATEDDTWTVSETVGTTTKTLQLTTNGAPARTTETSIPESDVQGGGAITGKFMKFKPTAAGTYVFEYIDNTDANNVKNYYKVIKVKAAATE